MKLFIDSADLNEIKQIADLGICDGVTTNPTLVAKAGQDFRYILEQIAQIVPGPISAEVIATEYRLMIKEAEELARISGNIVIKLPLTQEGIKTCRALSLKGIKTNVTLCFSVSQALLAAKAGATYISPFVGRIDDIGDIGLELIRDIRKLYDVHKFDTKILSASIRSSLHVSQSALMGADAATIPYKVFEQLFYHPLTTKGLDQFLKHWAESGQKSIV